MFFCKIFFRWLSAPSINISAHFALFLVGYNTLRHKFYCFLHPSSHVFSRFSKTCLIIYYNVLKQKSRFTLGFATTKNTYYIKSLWRRKCVRRRHFVRPLQPLRCLQHVQLCHCAGHLTPKMNIAFFIRNLMLNIKTAVFSEKTAKNCFGGAFDKFLGKEGVLCRKLT